MRPKANNGKEVKRASLRIWVSSETSNRKARTVIHKRCMREQWRDSLLSHVPFSRLSVAGAPAVSEDYAARCMRFPPGIRARCNNVLHTTRRRRRRRRDGGYNRSCNVTSANVRGLTLLCTRGDFTHRESKNEWNGTSLPVMLTLPNRDRRPRMIKSITREERRVGWNINPKLSVLIVLLHPCN